MSKRTHEPELLVVSVGKVFINDFIDENTGKVVSLEMATFSEHHVFTSMSKFTTFRKHIEKDFLVATIIAKIPISIANQKLVNRDNLVRSKYYKTKLKN